MANRILVDTGFWYAIFDKEDVYHKISTDIYNKYFNKIEYDILIPFPTMYELLRTKFIKNKLVLSRISDMLKNNKLIKVYDDEYRNQALLLTLEEPKRNISLVDNIIRLMLDDTKISAKGIITFNVGDFQDICRKKQVQILSY